MKEKFKRITSKILSYRLAERQTSDNILLYTLFTAIVIIKFAYFPKCSQSKFVVILTAVPQFSVIIKRQIRYYKK